MFIINYNSFFLTLIFKTIGQLQGNPNKLIIFIKLSLKCKQNDEQEGKEKDFNV